MVNSEAITPDLDGQISINYRMLVSMRKALESAQDIIQMLSDVARVRRNGQICWCEFFDTDYIYESYLEESETFHTPDCTRLHAALDAFEDGFGQDIRRHIAEQCGAAALKAYIEGGKA